MRGFVEDSAVSDDGLHLVIVCRAKLNRWAISWASAEVDRKEGEI